MLGYLRNEAMTDDDNLVYHTAEYVENLTDEGNVCRKRVEELIQEVCEFEKQLDRNIERMHEIDTRTQAVLQALQSGTFDENKQQSELEKLMREYEELTQLGNTTLQYTEILDELVFTIDIIVDIESELACDAGVEDATRVRHADEARKYTEMKQRLEERYATLLK